MGMVRIQRRAVIAGERRAAGISHFPCRSDAEQTALASTICNALPHDLHDACLRPAVDDECFGIRSRSSNTAAEQLSQAGDRKSTRLNSSHQIISYAVFCLKKKKNQCL